MDPQAFFEELFRQRPGSSAELAERIESAGVDEVRRQALRGLETGALNIPLVMAILSEIGLESVVPDLRRILRDREKDAETRAAALMLLGPSGEKDLAGLDPDDVEEILNAADHLTETFVLSSQNGTPFESFARCDPEDADAVHDVLDRLVEAFLESHEAADLKQREAAGWWIREVTGLAIDYGHGPAVLWTGATMEEMLTELLPRKVTLQSESDAAEAIAALRVFWRWTSRVAKPRDSDGVVEVLDELEPDFPSIMMDESRYGMAKGLVLAGQRAGYDMDTQEGLEAFMEEYNARLVPAMASGDRKKAEAAKKRKAKMAKLSRRKNRKKK